MLLNSKQCVLILLSMCSVLSVQCLQDLHELLFSIICPHARYATYFRFLSIESCKKSVSRKNTSCILVLLCLQSLQSFQ